MNRQRARGLKKLDPQGSTEVEWLRRGALSEEGDGPAQRALCFHMEKPGLAESRFMTRTKVTNRTTDAIA